MGNPKVSGESPEERRTRQRRESQRGIRAARVREGQRQVAVWLSGDDYQLLERLAQQYGGQGPAVALALERMSRAGRADD